jgi:NRPS condensation-like uncharacterized protein
MRKLRHLDIDYRKELTITEQLMGNFVEMRTLRLNMRKLEALPEGMENMEKVLRKKKSNGHVMLTDFDLSARFKILTIDLVGGCHISTRTFV